MNPLLHHSVTNLTAFAEPYYRTMVVKQSRDFTVELGRESSQIADVD